MRRGSLSALTSSSRSPRSSKLSGIFPGLTDHYTFRIDVTFRGIFSREAEEKEGGGENKVRIWVSEDASIAWVNPINDSR